MTQDLSIVMSSTRHNSIFHSLEPILARILNRHRFRPLWLRSSVVSVLLSVTAGTTTNVVSIVTLIFGTGDELGACSAHLTG